MVFLSPSPNTHLPTSLQFASRTRYFTPEASLLAVPVAHTLPWTLGGECSLSECLHSPPLGPEPRLPVCVPLEGEPLQGRSEGLLLLLGPEPPGVPGTEQVSCDCVMLQPHCAWHDGRTWTRPVNLPFRGTSWTDWHLPRPHCSQEC